MACFIVPATEAIVTTIVAKVVKSKEEKNGQLETGLSGKTTESASRIPFSRKLKWLNTLLWGGSALLAFEHLWHGEVVPWFPFLTAVSDPANAAEMLHEMATVGVSMAILVTCIWLGMLGVSALIEKRAQKTADVQAAEEA